MKLSGAGKGKPLRSKAGVLNTSDGRSSARHCETELRLGAVEWSVNRTESRDICRLPDTAAVRCCIGYSVRVRAQLITPLCMLHSPCDGFHAISEAALAQSNIGTAALPLLASNEAPALSPSVVSHAPSHQCGGFVRSAKSGPSGPDWQESEQTTDGHDP